MCILLILKAKLCKWLVFWCFDKNDSISVLTLSGGTRCDRLSLRQAQCLKVWSENSAGMVGHDLAALNTNTRTAMSESDHQSQERKTRSTRPDGSADQLLVSFYKICQLLRKLNNNQFLKNEENDGHSRGYTAILKAVTSFFFFKNCFYYASTTKNREANNLVNLVSSLNPFRC